MDWTKTGFECIKNAISALNSLKKIKPLNDEINIQTNADVASHNTIIECLKKNKVSCNIFSEEEKNIIEIKGGDKNILIILDPIDNTHLYVRGEKSFCSVAMMVIINKKTAHSFVGDIVMGDIYHCDQNNAYKNNKVIKVPTEVPGRKIILGWAPYQLRLERLYRCLGPLTSQDYYLYNFGGQLQAVKIATGNYDAYVEVRAETLNEFCGAAIVERAGGAVSTLQGKPIEWNPTKKQTLIVARNKDIQEDILRQFKDKDYED